MSKILAGVALLFMGIAALANEIPVSSFGHVPVIEQPSVSPDGKFVAAVLNTGDVPGIAVGKFGSIDLTTVLKLKFADDRIEWVRWANNDRLLVSASFSTRYNINRIRLRRLYAVDYDGENMKELRRYTGGEQLKSDSYVHTDNVISTLPGDPNNILVQLESVEDNAMSVFKVDINKNKFAKQFVNKYEVDRWVADETGRVTLGIGVDDGVVTTWHRESGQEEFQELFTHTMFEGATFSPVAVEGNKAIVLSDRELRRQALWQYDILTAEFEKLLFAHDRFDVDAALMDIDRTRVIGASWYEHFEEREYFNENDARTHQIARQSFPQFRTFIASRSRDSSRLIVAADRDDSPRKYFWLDLQNQKGGAWFSQYPQLEGIQLANVSPFEFEASDGTTVNGYLTLPPQSDGKPPLVVYPHGGPHSRDYQYFDSFVQLFANRGYAVLQVNFRGSTGYGSNFEVAGYRQWGGLMQQDVYDAFAWLESQKIVDTERACIVGSSYGGYVALTAAFQRPRQFQCIASLAGVSDLAELVLKGRFYDTGSLMTQRMIGDPGNAEQKAMLLENSPIEHVDQMKRPILLIHGTRDTQVRITQSADFFRKAKSADLKVDYLELELGTHYLDDNKNRLATFEALDRFLKKHLN